MVGVKRAWVFVVGSLVMGAGVVLGSGAASASPPDTTSSASEADIIEGEYLVKLKPTADSDDGSATLSSDDLHSRVENLMAQLQAAQSDDSTLSGAGDADAVLAELPIIEGFGARLSPESAERLAELPGVEAVYPNQVVTLDAAQENPTWGLDRIDQKSLPLDNSYTAPNDGSGVNIYIVDGAIITNHVEFENRFGDGIDLLPYEPEAYFCFLHGNHVAGTAGGKTVGVAQKATLHSVRTFDCNGRSSVFTILQGLDWVAQNAKRPAVVNMSFGGAGLIQLQIAAVDHLAALGIVSVAAAGNEHADACDVAPANAPQAITVGASTKTDGVPYFSNFGPCVDVFAPGVDIISAGYNLNEYVPDSGTSMSAPHVAGAAAVYLHDHPDATPAQVQDAIVRGAATNKLKSVPSGTPNRLLNVQALPAPGKVDTGTDPDAYIVPLESPAVEFGGTTVIDASQSTDPNGSPLTYEWTVDDSTEVVGTDPTFEFLNLERGWHSINVKVTNQAGKADTTYSRIIVVDPDARPPVARLNIVGLDVAPGRQVTFDARGSYDPYGGELAYDYRLYEVYGNQLDLVDQGNESTFTYDFDGGYEYYLLELIVVNEKGIQNDTSADVIVRGSTSPIYAVIDPDYTQKVPVGTKLSFDGSLTEYILDSPTSTRTYDWRLSNAWNQPPTGQTLSADPTFTYTFNEAGEKGVHLTVADEGSGATRAWEVKTTTYIEVVEPAPPKVVLTPSDSVSVTVGEPVTFSGVGSEDPDGGVIKPAWTASDKSGVVSGDIVYGRVFDKPGRYTVTFAATDDEGAKTSKSVTVNVTAPPIAEFTPGTELNALVGQTVSFDGSASKDPDGGTVKFEWRSTGVSGIASKTSKYSRKFTKPGRFGVELTVIDDEGQRSRKHINVWVADPKPPVAVFTPGSNQRIVAGTTLSFDGSGSKDPDGGSVKFVWRSSGVSGVASRTSKYSRKFTKAGTYGVEMIVTDDESQQTKKRVEVTVVDPKPPVAVFTPGSSQRVSVGATLSFDGSASKDPDGGSVKFEWRSTGVSGIASRASKYSRKFTKAGRFGVELTVVDDEGQRTKKHIDVWVS